MQDTFFCAEERRAALGAQLEVLAGAKDLPGRRRAELAQSIVRQVNAHTLAALSPDDSTLLAAALAQHPEGPQAALRELEKLPSSPQRTAMIRTLFLKTPIRSFERSSALVDAFAKSLAAHVDPHETNRRAASLRAALSTKTGRALLVAPEISAAARLWAAGELMRQNTAVQAALFEGEPWESETLLEAHAVSRMEQYAIRGGSAVLSEPFGRLGSCYASFASFDGEDLQLWLVFRRQNKYFSANQRCVYPDCLRLYLSAIRFCKLFIRDYPAIPGPTVLWSA